MVCKGKVPVSLKKAKKMIMITMTSITRIMTTTLMKCGSIHKLDVEKKEFTAKWEDPKCRATEPQFVPRRPPSS